MKNYSAFYKPDIKIVYKRPPFWRILKLFFPDYDPEGTVAVSFGKHVYANQDFEDCYKAHESIHLLQQKNSYIVATFWWIRYLFSKTFRFNQELEAFSMQYRYIVNTQKYWNSKRMWLHRLGSQLASPLYGSMVDIDSAKRIIEQHAEEN